MRWAALALAACGCKDPAPPSPAPPPPPAPIAVDALDTWNVTPPDAKPRPPSPCDRLDPSALAKAIGASTLFAVDEGWLLGSESRLWICEYFELPKFEDGLHLMVELDTDATIDTVWRPDPTPNLDEKVTWRTYTRFGKPAAIGSAKYFSKVQVLSNGVRLDTHVGAKAMPAADRERRAVAAMTVVFDQLPDDAAPLIPKKGTMP